MGHPCFLFYFITHKYIPHLTKRRHFGFVSWILSLLTFLSFHLHSPFFSFPFFIYYFNHFPFYVIICFFFIREDLYLYLYLFIVRWMMEDLFIILGRNQFTWESSNFHVRSKQNLNFFIWFYREGGDDKIFALLRNLNFFFFFFNAQNPERYTTHILQFSLASTKVSNWWVCRDEGK